VETSSPRRKGYAYADLRFSAEGDRAWLDGREYREVVLPRGRERRFNLWLAGVLLFIFPGIPLVAWAGLQKVLLPLVAVFVVFVFGFDRWIHRCVRCGRGSRKISTPHHNAPVLFFCKRCHVFFEHGHIDGGWPTP